MTIMLVKTETRIQKLFKEFLDGKPLPASCCDTVMKELVNEDLVVNYLATVERVKSKLSMNTIECEQNVLYVNFRFLCKEEERPVLIRLLNMKYGNGYFIIVNMSEVVYVPGGSKNTCTTNEMEQWLYEVTEKHLARVRMSERKLKVKNYVAQVKNFFMSSKKPA